MSIDPQKGVVLRIENGYDFPLAYQANLVFERDGKRYFRPTSVCPVRAHSVGFEGWSDKIVGIALGQIQAADAAHMGCTDGSALTVTTQRPADQKAYVCTGDGGLGLKAPLAVRLNVDSLGGVHAAHAEWRNGSATFPASPLVSIDYPLQGDVASVTPDGVAVLALAGTDPWPKATTANIVLSVGAEEVVHPWQMFAQTIAAGPKPGGKFFVGVIPIFLKEDGQSQEPGVPGLLQAVGREGSVLKVKVVGSDGTVFQAAEIDVSHPLVRSQTALDPLLAEAQAKAKKPAQCSP